MISTDAAADLRAALPDGLVLPRDGAV